jgi:hypothetical protein
VRLSHANKQAVNFNSENPFSGSSGTPRNSPPSWFGPHLMSSPNLPEDRVLGSNGMSKNSQPSSFGLKAPFTPRRQKSPPNLLEDSWETLIYDATPRSMPPVHKRITRASLPAVSKLHLHEPRLPTGATKHTTKHTEFRSELLAPSLRVASQAMAWMHDGEPRDRTVRAGIASCTAVTFDSEDIRCHVSFESQILPAHKILAFVSDLRARPEELILSLQIGPIDAAPKERRNLESILRKAHEQQEVVRVCWKEAVVSFKHMRAQGQSSLVRRILWSRLHMVIRSLLRPLLREAGEIL